jgi:hypothetical protein
MIKLTYKVKKEDGLLALSFETNSEDDTAVLDFLCDYFNMKTDVTSRAAFASGTDLRVHLKTPFWKLHDIEQKMVPLQEAMLQPPPLEVPKES